MLNSGIGCFGLRRSGPNLPICVPSGVGCFGFHDLGFPLLIFVLSRAVDCGIIHCSCSSSLLLVH